MSTSRRPGGSGKRSRARPTSPVDPPAGAYYDQRFRDAACEAAYNDLMRLKISVARSVSPTTNYGVGLWALFANTGLATLLGQEYGFCSSFFLIWCANMYEGPAGVARSAVGGQEMEITAQDLWTYLRIPSGGEPLWPLFRKDDRYVWTAVNTVLRGYPSVNYHDQDAHYLCRDAYLIQHVLRTSVFPKGGDRRNITATLSLATYYIMAGIRFDIGGAILQLISRIPVTRRQQRLKNIPFGHVIQLICSLKYNMPLPGAVVNDVSVRFFKPRDIFTIVKFFEPNGMRTGTNMPLGDQFIPDSDPDSGNETEAGPMDAAADPGAEAGAGLEEGGAQEGGQRAQDPDMGQGAGGAEGQPAGRPRRAPRPRPSATVQLDSLRVAAARSEQQYAEHRAALMEMREENRQAFEGIRGEQAAQRRLLDSVIAGQETGQRSMDELLRLFRAQSFGHPQPPTFGAPDAGGSGAGDPGEGGSFDLGDIGVSPGGFL